MTGRMVVLYTSGADLPPELKSGTDLAVADIIAELSLRWETVPIKLSRSFLPAHRRHYGAVKAGAPSVMMERLARCPSPAGILLPGDTIVLADDYAGLAMRHGWNPAILVRHNALHQSYSKTPRTSIASALRLGYNTWLARRFDIWTSRAARAVLAPAGTTDLLLKGLVPEANVLPWHPRVPRLQEGPMPRRTTDSLTGVFFANFLYEPNFEAFKFLCEDLAPAVGSSNTRFVVAGPAALERAREVHVPSNVEVGGFVPDLVGFCQSCDFGILPMFHVEGILLKTLTLMGFGMPIVSTSAALAGTGLRDGIDVLEANDTGSMVRAIRRLADPALRARLGAAAWEAAEPFSTRSGITEAIETLLAGPR